MRGKAEYNLASSKRYANQLNAYLIKNEISSKLFKVIPKEESEPVYTAGDIEKLKTTDE